MSTVNIALLTTEMPCLPYQKLLFHENYLFGANRNGKVYKYHDRFQIVATHEDWVNDVLINNNNIYSCSNDNSIFCNNVPIGYHSENVVRLQFTNSLISASTDGNIAVWNQKVDWIKSNLKLTSMYANDNSLLISTIDGKIALLDLCTHESSTIINSKDMIQSVFQNDNVITAVSGSNSFTYDIRNTRTMLALHSFDHRITSHHTHKNNTYYGLHNGDIYTCARHFVTNVKSAPISMCCRENIIYASTLHSPDIQLIDLNTITTSALQGNQGILNAHFSHDKTTILYKTISQRYVSWNLITNTSEIKLNESELNMGNNYLASWATLLVKCGNLYLIFDESKINNSEIFFEDLTPEELHMIQRKSLLDRINIGAFMFLSFFRNQLDTKSQTKPPIRSPVIAKIKNPPKNSPISSPVSPINNVFRFPRRNDHQDLILSLDSRSQSEPLFNNSVNWPFEVSFLVLQDFPMQVGQFKINQFNHSVHTTSRDMFPNWAKSLFILLQMPACLVSKLSFHCFPFSSDLPELHKKPRITAHRYMKLYKVIKYIKETTNVTCDLELIINNRVVPESSTVCTAYFLYSKGFEVEGFKKVEMPDDLPTLTEQDVVFYYRKRSQIKQVGHAL
eukprot:NODE_81_length_22753_cov_0.207072.p5 type:complete len:620 gc:universal NODE_81_length_22753_cov_0.207072:20834-22693(+)